jgi:alkanesulfonate monooxygenase SsuD/methylene tetrahydromethanopterin reductase-like flavin-dependent oxidoreductase (luciferase family)
MPIADMVRFARKAEDAGFETVWVPEVWRECFVPLTAIALATSRVTIGSAIALSYARSPVLMAQGAANLDEVSNGRFILGIGVGAPELDRMWHSGTKHAKPVTHLREVSEAVQLALTAHSGKAVSYEGQEVRLQNFELAYQTARDEMPLYLGITGPAAFRLSGRIADGAMIGALNSARYFKEIVYPNLEQGVAQAGRRLEDVDVASYIICVIGDDEDEAREMARYGVAFYMPFAHYRIVLQLHGYDKEMEAAGRALAANDIPALVACATDEIVDTLAIYGTPSQVRDKVDAYREYVKLPILYAPSTGLPPDRVRRNIERTIETFAV